jgi:hypothetical protein
MRPDESAAELHGSSIDDLFDRFAAALKQWAPHSSELKYFGLDGDAWLRDDWRDKLHARFDQNVAEGDTITAAMYCAFAWHHGWRVQLVPPRNDVVGGDIADVAARFTELMMASLAKIAAKEPFENDDYDAANLLFDLHYQMYRNDPVAVAALAAYAWHSGVPLNGDWPRDWAFNQQPNLPEKPQLPPMLPQGPQFILYTWRQYERGPGRADSFHIAYGDYKGAVIAAENEAAKWVGIVGKKSQTFDEVEVAKRFVERTIQGLIGKRVAAARATLALYHPLGDEFAIE